MKRDETQKFTPAKTNKAADATTARRDDEERVIFYLENASIDILD